MASQFIGVIVGTRTRTPYHVINPIDDSELDNSPLLLSAIPRYEPVRMLRVPRQNYEASVKTPHDLQRMIELVLRLEEQHG